MPKPIAEFFTDHPVPADRKAVLLGKGPSLDDYIPTIHPKGAPVFGLNQVPQHLPCTVALYVDGLTKKCTFEYPPDTIVIHFDKWTHEGANEVYTYRWPRWDKLPSQPNHLPMQGRKDVERMGSSSAALTVLAVWGITSVLMVGFDGMDGIEDNARLFPEGTPDMAGGKTYAARINPAIWKTLCAFNVSAYWFHRGEYDKWATTPASPS